MSLIYSALNEILCARWPITEKTVLLFETTLGVGAEHFYAILQFIGIVYRCGNKQCLALIFVMMNKS